MLIDHLGIRRLLAVAGGSMGGMQALEWAVAYPEMRGGRIPIATTARHSAQQIAFNEVGRQAIMADPDWNDGQLLRRSRPARGLAVARMVGHITYMSDDSMREKFGRRLRDKETTASISRWISKWKATCATAAAQFVDRFDANSYLYITKAMDYFDLANGHGSLAAVFERSNARSWSSASPPTGSTPATSRWKSSARCAAATATWPTAICNPTTATTPSWWTWTSRPNWCAASWPAP